MADPEALTSTIFTGLSGLAFVLLWVLMGLNGTLVALLRTAWSGVFPDGEALKTSYTGFILVDFPLRILVAFFYGLQNLVETPPYLMLVDLVAALLVINMMTLVESCRPRAAKWLRSSLLWQYLWNCAGVALFLPIYSRVYVKQRQENPAASRVPAEEGHALPYTAVWSLLLPLPLLVPALVRAAPFRIQDGLVVYLLTPALFVLFQVLASKAVVSNKGKDRPPAYKHLTSRPVKAAYWITGTASALLHLGVVSYVFFSRSPGGADLSLLGLYLPDHRIVRKGSPDIMTSGALLFFQWDFIIINAVVVLLAVGLTQLPTSPREAPRDGRRIDGQALAFLLITAVLGCGAGLAFLLWCEEDRLDALYAGRDKHACEL